jgi:hypothetical protein
VRHLAIALGAVLLAAPAAAEVYRWTDATGGVHYSSDLDDVPESQREAAQRNAGGTGRGAVMRLPARPASPAPRPTPAAAPTGAGGAPSPTPPPERIGGRSEEEWRAQAEVYRGEIARLEREAEACSEGEFRWSAGAGGRGEAASDDACGRVKRELDTNRGWLDALEDDAHRAGVPPGWLRD